MLAKGKKCQCVSGLLHPWIGVILIAALSSSAGKAQTRAASDSLQARDIGIIELDRGTAHTGAEAVPSDRVRRITLEQVKQSADPAARPLARRGQLSVEAAREHRLGVQAQYFPKFSATFLICTSPNRLAK